MKDKNTAAFLALFFGVFGVHRFYLNQRFYGAIYFFLFFIGMIALVEEESPLILLPVLLGFIDTVLFFVMPKEDFDERYNLEEDSRRQHRRSRSQRRRETTDNNLDNAHFYKGRAIKKFRQQEYEAAIDDFLAALDINYDDAPTHFNLACCYSLLGEAGQSFFHLNKAVEMGFDRFEKIHEHHALDFLRQQPEFDSFIYNNYKLPANLPAPQENFLDQKPVEDEFVAPQSEGQAEADDDDKHIDWFEELIQLGELRDKGILTEDEFYKQKKRIMRDNQ